jgi:hypothetical protein
MLNKENISSEANTRVPIKAVLPLHTFQQGEKRALAQVTCNNNSAHGCKSSVSNSSRQGAESSCENLYNPVAVAKKV